MKPGVHLLGVSFATLLLAAAAAGAQHERILHFDSRIEIRADASLVVTETIRVRAAGAAIKRGIYRDFPQLYRGRWGLRQRTAFDVLQARRDGEPESFRLEPRENGQRVYLGRSGVMLAPGDYTYALTYRTDRQLGFFPDHDELYWNVTGNGWTFAMDQVTATVILPRGAAATTSEAYTGPSGARGRDDTRSSPTDNTIQFETTRPLRPREGLTIVAAWPKGFVQAPAARDPWLNLLRDNPGVAIALVGLLLILGYYLAVWAAVGRDPAPGTIIPQYGPPKGFSPAAVRYLVDMRFDHKAFAANLISLAVKGAITLEQSTGKTYTVNKKNGAAELLPDEKTLFQHLLDSRSSLPLQQSNHAVLRKSLARLKQDLAVKLEKTHFRANFRYWLPGLLLTLVPFALSLRTYKGGEAWGLLLWLAIWTTGVTFLLSSTVTLWRGRQWPQALFMTCFSLPFLGGELMGIWLLSKATSIWVPLLFLLGALINGIFYHLLKAPTKAGRRLLDHIEGFRLYLSVAEQERLNLENPPQRTPELFEQFLPYALALNVEQQWAEQFEAVLAQVGVAEHGIYSPSWYRGTAWSTIGTAGFVSSLGSSLAGAIASSSTAPGSSSGGGGGGSSGGGGGGGGGGGW
jgi:uncharacterized membrane protein YgcG